MTGLLWVLSEPGDVPLAVFHHWYDTEHAPARLTVPGVVRGDRFAAVDDETPGWLATYPIALEALDSPEYAAVRQRSPREQRLVARLATLDRRVYERVEPCGEPAPGPAPFLLAVGLTSTDPARLDAWYLEEHLPLLATVPGWRRSSRFRRRDGAGPEHLALHEIDDRAAFDTAEYRRAVGTPWRDEVMATVVGRERRLFAHHGTVGIP
jgi:hypothetical protein